jgi:hypothetical protein
MNGGHRFLTQSDIAKMTGFFAHTASHFFTLPDGPLYHYTSGDGLIGIIRSKQLWSTQIACLNDSTEIGYALGEINSRVAAMKAGAHDPNVDPMLGRLAVVLSEPGLATSPAFITCLSAAADSLPQWRGYANGEGGYAIEFDAAALKAAFDPNDALLVRAVYSPGDHAMLFDDILKWSAKYFLELDGAKVAPSVDEWVEEFLQYWLENLYLFMAAVKHPAFASE